MLSLLLVEMAFVVGSVWGYDGGSSGVGSSVGGVELVVIIMAISR